MRVNQNLNTLEDTELVRVPRRVSSENASTLLKRETVETVTGQKLTQRAGASVREHGPGGRH